ncbi:kelch-like protein 32 isoform X6 [Panthera pardus]|uniref:BTB domain-containing protein n=5 Tax=Felidae TaxID=9681 RepID=A0ABI7WY45_FELCA|nr:kelch-like protein 32 isoform X6 [Panthera pardus]XP_019686547.1 kelch-like protein 32 isoform X4 [Felis catus]XP_025781057.1 kelch-like protein 32 isoform X5 [Puma concolor]XP_026913028.1 kelch-like protein 32 isoform X5 [Acinonyx jubatus]XP_040330151.1 kelch-like protein 32 isoform X4 [Puma yagouaroundi]XP_045355046.1 kelch-like protein 32 isoform X5 [Leopardus geoffroyi]XP_046958399.1 kelch-like protein 32 isoform X5 [Lynx rufus]XP_058590746.1 kelch-like protein 32 isoform X5 [Neofelis
MPSERCLSIQEMLTGQRLCHSESHNDSVLAALNQQRSDGILCDVTLIAEEQKFHAHKAVLAACSDYFRAMFSLCMVESGADEVSLHGVTSLGLKQALEFAYTGQILLEPGVIQDVLAAGSHLQLLELLNLCSHYLIQLAVRWLEHNCHYQYMDELLQYIRFGLMDVDTLHTVALSHPLVQASETATALVNEALEYHQSIYAQPVWQTRRTKPRFQSDTLYIIGGKKREVCKVKELRYFNPVDQENALIAAIANWSELAPMPVGRSHHCVAVMGDFLFVAGGEVEHASGRTCAVRTACRYDPRSNSWAEIAPMKNCREHFVLGAMDEYLYAVGGRNELRQVLPTVERYCPKKNKWTFVQSFDRSLSCHAGYVADGLLWISGGVTNTAQYQNRLMVYEPNQNKWISRSPMLQRRVYHSMAAVQRKLYVLGGNDLDYNNDRILVRHIDSYNIDTDQWTRCNFNLLTGQNESGVAVHNERIYLVGGYSIWTNEPLACIQVVDVSREGKEEVFYGPTLPFASNGIAACFLPAPYFTCPNLQTLQVPHHRIGTI